MGESRELEERILRLETALRSLTARVRSLEAGRPAGAVEAETAQADLLETAPSAGATDRLQGVASLVGRTCLVLGGAFLVRALTEAGTLTPAVGVTLGILYAFAWLFLADRAAAKGHDLSGAFHALASALVVYPLVLESATRFQLLGPLAAALLLAAATALGLWVAWRRSFHTVAWITVLAALGVDVLLLFRTRAVLEFVGFLLALALASLILAYGRGWRGQRWVVALAVDSVVLLLGALQIIGRGPPEWLPVAPVLIAQIGLTVVYLSAFVLRLLLQKRLVTSFAVTQTVLVLLIGFEAALWVGPDAARRGLAVGALGLGALLHAVLARGVERKGGEAMAFAYFSSLATFLAAEGVRVLLPSLYPSLWALAAVAVAALSLSGRRPVLEVHAGLLAVAGLIASGLPRAAVDALSAAADAEWAAATTTAPLVLLLAAAALVMLYRSAPLDRPHGFASTARVAALVAVLLGLGGVVVRWLASAIAAAPGAEADAGRLAAVRTAVLAVTAVLLVLVYGASGRVELARLAGVVLGFGGLRLLLEDLRVGSAAVLVFSLVVYGAALVAVPALARRVRRGRPADETERETSTVS